MKKFLRFVFILFSIGALLLSVFILFIDIQQGRNTWRRLQENYIFWIPLLWGLLAIPSIAFQIEKLIELVKPSTLYGFTRICDLIYSIYMSLIAIVFFIGFSIFVIGLENVGGDIFELIIPLGIAVISLTISILMFIDNIKFHKGSKQNYLIQSIEEIGTKKDELEK